MFTTRMPQDRDSAWIYQRRYVALNNPAAREFADRFSRVLVAGALARDNLPDSARRVLLAARATPALDPRREIAGYEAMVRVILGDYDEAVDLLDSYLAANPEHRKGFGSRVSPWWRDIQSFPRFKRLLATAR